MIKESQIYQKFFLKNRYYLLIPSIVFTLGGAYFNLNQIKEYQIEKLWQISNSDNIQSQVVLADEAVSEIRNRLIQNQLGLDAKSKANAFKVSPLSISVGVSNPKQIQAEQDLDKVNSFLEEKFPVKSLTDKSIKVKSQSLLLYISLGFLAGFSIGLLISLIKTYLRNY